MADQPEVSAAASPLATTQPVTSPPIQTKINAARSAGYSWDEINGYLGQKRQEAKDAGYTDAEVNSYLGQTDQTPANANMAEAARASNNTEQPKPAVAQNWWQDWKAGIERSSGGLMVEGQPSLVVDEKHSDFFGRLVAQGGEVLGDVPAMIGGATLGTGAGALVPGGGETGVTELLGGGFGLGALPQQIKGEYADGLLNGSVKDPKDFMVRQAHILMDTVKAGVVSTATVGAGKLASIPLKAAGAKIGTQVMSQLAAEYAAMTATASAVQQKLPTIEELADGAILLAGFKGVGVINDKVVAPIRANLIKNWRDTGQKPTDAVNQAQHDPAFRANMAAPKAPDPPPASSATPTKDTGDFTIPRVPNEAFDKSVTFVLNHEGGITTDTGGLTKYGISQKAHPDVDIKNLTKQQAIEIYHNEYWKPLGLDNLPADARTPVFDAAVNEGVAKARQMWESSGGDVQKFLSLRDAHYQVLANEPKYAPYLKAWEGRVSDLGYKGTPPAELPESDITKRVSGEGDPWKNVMATIAPPTKGPGLAETFRDEAYKAYTDLFNPMHPINQLTRAATQGEPVPDAENPDFLYRLAENHNTHAMYNIERNATDLDGNITGPGLNKIVEPFGKGDSLQRFWAYAKSKWALEKGEAGKETGVNLDDAREVVSQAETGSQKIPVENPLDIAKRIGAKYEDLNPIDYETGPHFDKRSNTIRLYPEGAKEGAAVEAATGLTRDEIFQHELGHAIAHHLELGGGVSAQKMTALSDAMQIASRRFRPEQWRDITQKQHVNKDSELIADALATWTSDPLSRNRLGVLRDIIGSKLDAFGTAPGDKYGTPMSRAFDQLQNWQNNTATWLRDSGVSNNEAHLFMLADIKSRIPAYREGMQPKSISGRGAGKTAYQPIKSFEGSDRRTADPYQALMQDAFLRSQLGLYNRANMALADLGEKTGLATKGGAEKFKPNPDASMEDDMDSTIAKYANKPLAKDGVPVLRDGKMESWKFDDPNIARVLRGMDQQTRTIFQKMAQPFTKFVRGSIVLNPLFPIRLMSYDVPWQFITKPGMRNTIADTLVGLGHIVGDTPTYDAWLRSGGAEKVFDGLGKQDYIKKMLADHADPSYADTVFNTVKTPYHALKTWAQTLNQAQRVGRFARPNEGETEKQIAVASADAAFHRASFGGPLAKSINAIQPFTAAYLNSLEQTFKAFTGHGLTGEKVFDAKTVGLNVAKATAVITLPMMAQYLQNKDKDWYKAVPAWQKDNGLVFRVGGEDASGHTIFVKYPPLISFLFGGLPRRLFQQFAEDSPHAWDHISQGLGGALLPPGGLLTYNVMTPIIEHVANYSFFKGHPLVPDDVRRNSLPPEQFNNYSTHFSKQASKYVNDLPILRDMNLSPPVIDNYIQSWGSGLGDAAVKFTELATNANPKAPASRVEDWPLLSSWLSRYPSASAQPIQDFEDRMDRLSQVHGSLTDAFKNHDLSRFGDLAQANPAATELHRFGVRGAVPPENEGAYVQQLQSARTNIDTNTLRQLALTERALKNQQRFVKQVYEQDPQKYSPQDKRQILDQSYSLMQLFAQKGNALLDKLGAK